MRQNTIVRIGDTIKVDGDSISQQLQRCDWDQADFRLPRPCLQNIWKDHQGLACRVEVTGRVLNWKVFGNHPGVRVKIILIGDGEPDQTLCGWLLVNLSKRG